ncbi:MAG: hypothetical protein HFE46_07500 [Clostridia bacterium]|nr:hypothetical protein [Clostridia bacterium]
MAEEEIIRQNKTNVTAEEKERYIDGLKKSADFTFKSFLPVTDNCHFERYAFLSGKEKLGIVYDTKAHMLSCTAKQSVLARVSFLGNAPQSVEQPQQKSQNKQAQQKPQNKQTPPSGKKQAAKNKPKQPAERPPVKPPPPDMPLEKPADKDTKEPKVRSLSVVARQEKLPQIRKERQKLPQVNNRRETLPQTVPAAWETSNQKQKASRGKKDKRDKENVALPVLDKKTEKALRKLMPDAFDLLGAQSLKDFAIGMTDIGNEKVRLSDYSVLLVPPYRGLERFIFDLQQARGISVKMIGQAYEKDADGRHVLKQCYRRKVGVVYSEVMGALYAEYFANRNFYAHSDNTETDVSRMIADKATAEKIFDTLCEIVNYNGKKLTEIGFVPVKE